ncbi:hypothetical protein DPMN_047659 [Dreissena polymorpha]|uniref:Uncharacterized protein n=1 Tax=Dreissena polymorpha TaxID=45954 RepID=A0A9D4D946_DREPO|nr:hypothetical protein DPMN_047659 [Dreissena polymorpha]
MHDKFPDPGGNVFQQAETIFELIQDIIKTTVLTKFHEDWTIKATFECSHEKFSAPWRKHFRTCRRYKSSYQFHEDRTINVASRLLTRTIFEQVQDIIGTNLLTKFHDARTINLASKILRRENTPPPWWLLQDIIGTNLLTKVLTRFNYSNIRKKAPPSDGHVFQPT